MNVPQPTVTERLLSLRDRIDRNVPDHREPERFHLEKSDIVREIEQLAQERAG